jgi:uncharacterized coiled-coil protein SlyX
MAFDKVILGVITRTVKSTARFDISINSIKTQFDNGCPAPQELTKIIQSKNQINQALTQALGALGTINSTAGTINGVLTGIDAAITTIKTIPIPSAITPLAPAGVGPSLIPGRIFPTLSDALITLRDFVKKNKETLNQIPPAISSIRGVIQGVASNLGSLDVLISKCLNEQTSNLSPEAKAAYFNEIGFALTQTGNNSNPNINSNVDSALEAQLQPNSNNPLFYKGFKLTLEYDVSNTFSFPSRRIKGVNDETGQILYNSQISGNNSINNTGGKFSYSSSTQVLFDEIKFQIDILTPTVNVIDEVNDIIKEVKDTVDTAQAEADRLAEEARRAAEEALNPPPPPPPPFPPFGEAGYGNEIRQKITGETLETLALNYYQFKSDLQQWVIVNIDPSPFFFPGERDGEEQIFVGFGFGEDLTGAEVYVWSNDKLKWIYKETIY